MVLYSRFTYGSQFSEEKSLEICFLVFEILNKYKRSIFLRRPVVIHDHTKAYIVIHSRLKADTKLKRTEDTQTHTQTHRCGYWVASELKNIFFSWKFVPCKKMLTIQSILFHFIFRTPILKSVGPTHNTWND